MNDAKKVVRRNSAFVRYAMTLSLVLTPAIASAQTTLTFGPGCTTGTLQSLASPLSENGFTLTDFAASPTAPTPSFLQWCTPAPNFAGVGLWSGGLGTFARLTRDNGHAFSANAIDLAPLTPADIGTNISLTFIGTLLGGGTVTQTFLVAPANGRPVFETFDFDSRFSDLTSLEFAAEAASPNRFQFANIRLDDPTTTVPEPGTLALLAAGLSGVLGVTARRRKML